VAHALGFRGRAPPPPPPFPADDSFRSKFLWGRRPMLAACAARLRDFDNMVGGWMGAAA
jgi:hypothetical protein